MDYILHSVIQSPNDFMPDRVLKKMEFEMKLSLDRCYVRIDWRWLRFLRIEFKAILVHLHLPPWAGIIYHDHAK